MALSDQIVSAESGGDPNAQNPLSSAGGAGQFIDSTWLSMVGKYRPDLAAGKSRAEILALKTDPDLSKQMVGFYAQDNAKALSGAGLPTTPGNLYLAHFAGPQGAIGILTANPDASAASVLGPSVAKANPFLRNMTVADLQRWASSRVGGGQGAMNPAADGGRPPSIPAGAASPAASLGMLGGVALGGGQMPPMLPQATPAPALPAQEPPSFQPMEFRHLPMTAAVRARLLMNLFPQRTS